MLRAKASRATAIAAHRVSGGRRAAPVFFVGNRIAFGAAGEAPVAWTRKRRKPLDRTLVGEVLVALVGLAAGLHDIGKLTKGFQEFLLAFVLGGTGERGKAQPVRHELVSVLVIHAAIRASGAKSDVEFLERIADSGQAVALFVQGLREFGKLPDWAGTLATNIAKPDRSGVSLSKLLPDRAAFPFMRAVVDMVLSHHRLPVGEIAEPRRSALGQPARTNAGILEIGVWDGLHVDRSDHEQLPWADFLVPADAAFNEITGAPSGWGESVARDTRRALAILRDTGAFARREWIAASLHYGRLALMLGDHYASFAKAPTCVADPREAMRSTCFANTVSTASPRADTAPWADFDENAVFDADPPQPGTWLADRWSRHTHMVRRHSIAALAHIRRDEGWPFVEEDELPEALRSPEAAGSPYAWQDTAAEAVRNRPTKKSAALVFLMASTGTGKTIAIPKIARGLGRGLRLNVCLGLRSLTLQTGDEYLDRIGFSTDQAAVVIGSKTAKLLHEISRETEGAGPIPPKDLPEQEFGVGTDAVVESADAVISGGSDGAVLNPLAERVSRSDRQRQKRLRMLGTPVLVCTIDMLMSVSDGRRGGHLGDSLRVLSADLVLDELDALSPEDLVAVTRLVRFAAAHGRSVIGASATIRHAHAIAIREAFAAGRQEYAAVAGEPAAFDAFWASEHLVASHADDARAGASAAAFSGRHREIVGKMASHVSQATVRRAAFILPVTGVSDDASGHLEAALTGAVSLHSRNCMVDPDTGVRVSVGVVRWNRVRMARRFARRLATTSGFIPGTLLAITCYHSKFPLSVRNGIYARLAKMLTRKHSSGERDPLLDDENVRRHLERAKGAGLDDLICVVSTTNILEAGCDLDFDWAVAEPCSERSMLQLAGRVRRHRSWEWAKANLAILETSVPSPGGMGRIEKPGVETPVPMGFGRLPVYVCVEGARISSRMFPMPKWEQVVDATSCILDEASPCGTAERILLEAACNGHSESIALLSTPARRDAPVRPLVPDMARRVAALSSASPTQTPEILWTDLHARERRFRRQESGPEIEIARLDGQWLFREVDRVAGEWVSGGHLVKQSFLTRDGGASEAMLLGTSVFDIEGASVELEKRMRVHVGEISDWVSREMRSVSLQMPGSGAQFVFYDAVLGFDSSNG